MIEMGGEPVFIAEENRALYHAALAFAANHLVDAGRRRRPSLLRDGGRGQAGPDARPAAARRPGQRAAVRRRRPDRAGGPRRCGTVAAHLAAIASAAPAALRAYLALARLTADRALAAGMLSAGGRRTPARRAGGAPSDGSSPGPGGELAAAREDSPAPVVLVPTMGALHDGHRRCCAGPASWPARAARSWSRSSSTRCSSGRTRTWTGTRARSTRTWPPARPRAWTWCSRHRPRDVPAGAAGHGRSRADRGDPGGRVQARVLPRRADGRAQAFQPGPPGHRRLRPEGRAAAGARAQDVRRLRAGHRDRGGPDGAVRRRARLVEQEQVPVPGGAGRGARAAPGACRGRCRRAGRPWRGRRRGAGGARRTRA